MISDGRRESPLLFSVQATLLWMPGMVGTLGLLTWMLMSDANDLRRLSRLGELGMSAAARGFGRISTRRIRSREARARRRVRER